MDQSNIEFPKLTLRGTEHTIRFTRGAFAYHMSKKGLELADLRSNIKVIGTLTDLLMFAFHPPFQGSAEDLADALIEENKMAAANVAVHIALGKVFPTPTISKPAVEGEKPALQ
jgi:hypothetical protein